MSFVAEDEPVNYMVDSLTIIDEDIIDSTTLPSGLQEFEDVSETNDQQDVSEEGLSLETVETDESEGIGLETEIVDDKSKTAIPPLRPLTIAPKPAKVPVSFKPVAGQQLLLVQGGGAGQQIKLLSTSQGINLSNLSIAKPITIKQSVKPGNISLVAPKKVVMKKVIPKGLTKAFDSKPGQQIVLLQKSDPQVKLVSSSTPTKTLTLSQAQQMGIISGSTKVLPPSTKQIVLNKAGQSKAIKIVPQLRSPTKILPAPQGTQSSSPTKQPQRIYLKQTNVSPTTHILPGQIIQVPGNQSGQVRHINLPGKGMQYIKFITSTQSMDTPSSTSSKVSIAKVSSTTTQSPKPVIKTEKPITNVSTVRTLPGSSVNRMNTTPNKGHTIRSGIKMSSGDAVVPTTSSPDLSIESNGIKTRKPCNCAKSQCLKLYCDCFANGEFCYMCNCMNCFNNLENEEHRQRAIKNCLERNPNAFRPKIGKGKDTGEAAVRKHTKGCNCKRSSCLKNYCECYEAKIACSSNCKCMGCMNVESVPITFPDPLETSTCSTADSGFSTSPQSSRKVPTDSGSRPRKLSASRQPSNYITNAVIEATSQCLITMAKNAEEQSQNEDVTKTEIIEEFGRCLKQIIECSAGFRSLFLYLSTYGPFNYLIPVEYLQI